MQFPMSFGIPVKGAGSFRRNRCGKLIRNGWGFGLIPGHCHPCLADGALSGWKTRRASFSLLWQSLLFESLAMNLFELTRALVDIESITPHEEQVGLYLYENLSRLAAQHHGRI